MTGMTKLVIGLTVVLTCANILGYVCTYEPGFAVVGLFCLFAALFNLMVWRIG